MKKVQIVSIQMVREKYMEGEYNIKVESPSIAADVANKFLEDKDREYLIVFSLNTQNDINSLNVVSVGSLNQSIVHPREVFKTAILSNAASIILAHNHPSGNPTPSSEDINATTRIKECGDILGIKLLDHIIIGNEDWISFKESGYL